MQAAPDTTNPAAPDLNNIQGNVFGGFNKPHQALVYLMFADATTGKAFLAEMVDRLTTSQAVFDWKKTYNDMFPKDTGIGRHPDPNTEELRAGWINLVLSFSGLSLLGAPEADALQPEFKAGMAAAKERIGDKDESDPGNWIDPFKAPGDLHAMAIVGADTEAIREEQLAALRGVMGSNQVTELGNQIGDILPEALAGHEHFGFKDGVSQPSVKGIEAPEGSDEQVDPDQFVLTASGQAPAPAPEPAPSGGYPDPAPPAPAQTPAWAIEGSYLVYRRLHQNVAGFQQFIGEHAADLGLSPDNLGSLFVGRYKSGAPLEMTHKEAEEHSGDGFVPGDEEPRVADDVINDFDYEPQDTDGHLVPHAAHIRKVYPRNQKDPGEEEADRHRILRRGIPYGAPFKPGEAPYQGQGQPLADDGNDRGLLFLCYQASIRDQFEFIQQAWVNSPTFPTVEGGAEAGRDPIISQDVEKPTFHIPSKDKTLELARWVLTTGGEYFFSPSISGLRQLAA